ASYVSALLNAEDVRRLGLPYADYFIWSDDFEHTGRLLRHGHGLHVPASVVEHRTVAFGNAQSNPGTRFYYDVRNRIWALTRSRSFSPVEAVLHGGATTVAWLRLLARHGGALAGVGLRGLMAAIRRGPRPSALVLEADGDVAAAIRAIERGAGRCAGRGPPAAPRFVVLMPLWGRDVPERVEAALASATTQQQLPPDELVLTVDGPIPRALEAVVSHVQEGRYGPATVLRHTSHRGVAAALQDGLESITAELVARADADDLCRPERFALQIPHMETEELDLLGGAMREFSDRVMPGHGPLRT